MKLKSGAVEQFEQFSQFQSLTEFHHHMEMWLVDYKREFSKKELVGFKQLVRISARNPWSEQYQNSYHCKSDSGRMIVITGFPAILLKEC